MPTICFFVIAEVFVSISSVPTQAVEPSIQAAVVWIAVVVSVGAVDTAVVVTEGAVVDIGVVYFEVAEITAEVVVWIVFCVDAETDMVAVVTLAAPVTDVAAELLGWLASIMIPLLSGAGFLGAFSNCADIPIIRTAAVPRERAAVRRIIALRCLCCSITASPRFIISSAFLRILSIVLPPFDLSSQRLFGSV